MINNRKGFAVVIVAAVLPALIGGFLLLSCAVNLMQNDLALKYQCRVLGQKGQKKVAPYLNELLLLNPTAKVLKIEEIAARAQVAASYGNPVAFAAAQARLRRVQFRRRQLDQKQKQLVRQSNIEMDSIFRKTQVELRRTLQSFSNILFVLDSNDVRGSSTRLAVRPDSSDTAPTYSLLPQFEEKQALAHEWQYQISVRKPFSQFLPGKFQFKKACAVSLQKESEVWVPKIIRGKFSLKSVW